MQRSGFEIRNENITGWCLCRGAGLELITRAPSLLSGGNLGGMHMSPVSPSPVTLLSVLSSHPLQGRAAGCSPGSSLKLLQLGWHQLSPARFCAHGDGDGAAGGTTSSLAAIIAYSGCLCNAQLSRCSPSSGGRCWKA